MPPVPRRIVLLVAIVAVIAAPALASAGPVAAATTRSVGPASAGVPAALSRGFGGRGFFRGSRGTRFRRSAPRSRGVRPVRRPNIGRAFRNVLRALGIAYLLHLLFGWGAGGGSPIVLVLLLVLGAWLVSRTLRRRRSPYGSH